MSFEPISGKDCTRQLGWWGTKWWERLETWADLSDRLPRGLRYAKEGRILGVSVEPGRVYGKIKGSKGQCYDVRISSFLTKPGVSYDLVKVFLDKIDALEILLSGEFPEALSEVLFDTKFGVFPEMYELTMDCSCPDKKFNQLTICKHIATLLYGIGVRFDRSAKEFFIFREIQLDKIAETVIAQKIGKISAAGFY